MAASTLGARFLVSAFPTANLLGVSWGSTADRIIVTHDTKKVTCVSLIDGKPLNTYTLKHGWSFECPVVYDDTTGMYHALVKIDTCQKIYRWKPEATEVSKWQRYSVAQSIFTLLRVESFGVVLVYANGSIGSMKDLSVVTQPPRKHGEFLQSGIACKKDNQLYICVISQKQKLQSVRILVLSDNLKVVSTHTVALTLPAEVVCSCFTHDKEELLLLGKAGNLFSASLNNLGTGNAAVTGSQIMSLPATKVPFQSMYDLGEARVCVVSPEAMVALDLKYKMAEQPVAFDSKAKPELMVSTPQYVVVPCAEGLTVHPLQAFKTSLLSALGHLNPTLESSSGPKPKLWPMDDGESNKFISALQRLQEASTEADVSNCLKTLKQLTTGKDACGSVDVSAIVSTLTSQGSRLWHSPTMEFFVTSFALSPESSLRIIEQCLAKDDLALLSRCLILMPCVSEAAIVKSLVHVMDMTNDKVRRTGLQGETITKQNILDSILSLTFNDHFLVECLPSLGLDNAIIILQYLCGAVTNSETELFSTKDDECCLTTSQIADWCTCLLDVFYTELVLSPDAKALLKDLQMVVQDQVMMYNEMSVVESLLGQIEGKFNLPGRTSHGLYSIECLRIV